MHGDGAEEGSGEAAGSLGGVERDCHDAGARILRAAEHGLNAEKFDQRIEAICRKYYKSSSGRPSITPGTYFRMLLLGYFEGIDSERGIAWRAADSFSTRKFLGYDLIEQTPDHSTVSRTRRLYAVHTHGAVMKWVLKILRKHGLADGRSVCIDGTTLEANAAMKSLVRRDTGQSYEDYLRQLAASRRNREPDERAVGAAGSQAQEEGFQRRLDQSE